MVLRVCSAVRYAVLLPSSYARHNTTVVLQDMILVDNTVARGSAVFVVNSVLKTYQVCKRYTKWNLCHSGHCMFLAACLCLKVLLWFVRCLCLAPSRPLSFKYTC